VLRFQCGKEQKNCKKETAKENCNVKTAKKKLQKRRLWTAWSMHRHVTFAATECSPTPELQPMQDGNSCCTWMQVTHSELTRQFVIRQVIFHLLIPYGTAVLILKPNQAPAFYWRIRLAWTRTITLGSCCCCCCCW